MFMSSTLQASVFMVKIYSHNWHSIKNTENDLSMKQMFDISEKFTSEQSVAGISEFNELPRSIVVSSGCPDRSSTKLDTCTGEKLLSIRSSRSRVCISLTVGEEDEVEDDDEE